MGLGKLKNRGAKFISVNPIRTGYSSIADQWIPIRPGTDGLFIMSLIHQLLKSDKVDIEYLVRYTNAHWLVINDPGASDDGLFARDTDGNPMCWDGKINDLANALAPEVAPAVVMSYQMGAKHNLRSIWLRNAI